MWPLRAARHCPWGYTKGTATGTQNPVCEREGTAPFLLSFLRHWATPCFPTAVAGQPRRGHLGQTLCFSRAFHLRGH